MAIEFLDPTEPEDTSGIGAPSDSWIGASESIDSDIGDDVGRVTDDMFRRYAKEAGLDDDAIEYKLREMKELRRILKNANELYERSLAANATDQDLRAYRHAIHDMTELPHETLETLLGSLLHLYATAKKIGLI